MLRWTIRDNELTARPFGLVGKVRASKVGGSGFESRSRHFT